MYFPDSTVTDEPTHHELQSKSDVQSVATECSAMPQGVLCVFCPSPAEFSVAKSAALHLLLQGLFLQSP